MNCSLSEKSCTIMKVILVALAAVAFCILILGVTTDNDATHHELRSEHAPKRVIVDVDVGPDDAWALFYLLNSPDVHVEAISCVRGNTNVTNVGRNVLRVLAALGKHNETPVYLGSNERIITPGPIIDPKDMYFGSDGFSDIVFLDMPEPNMDLLKGSAIIELNKLIEQYPNEITFICLGPLTNLALLLKVFPETRKSIKEVFIMGGNRHGVGNTESAAEFNFYNDPEGAHVVINDYPGNITILPWESSSQENLIFDQTWRFDVLGNSSNPVVQMLNLVERKPLGENDKWMPCDALVPMAFTDPDIVTERKLYRGNVELYGWLTRGQLVLDHMNEGVGNITIIDNMNRTQIMEKLTKLAFQK
ncbi:uncharacterized protein LOC129773977 isoform X2 [Toxorhynchites rutilus septentrionalis]|uniref:uncharacterized protein LOC129773977 isoform X2 n=1 Tax=Toxorhynchites rutilus septentrionalis TaxID=329112 RepID=UPI0024795D90|nr:uncharacterized protein LOC129773977 isoform X2 [Toxorhynchites rutilus septentrionalis]